jgi:hypothetical protein
MNMYWYNDNGGYTWNDTVSNATTGKRNTFTVDWIVEKGGVGYVRYFGDIANMGTYIRVEDTSTHEVLFEWRA